MYIIREIFVFLIVIILFGLILNFILKNNFYFDLFLGFLIFWIIFINVNPYHIDENKYSILSYIPKEYMIKDYLLNNVNINDIKYPVVFKPVRCSALSKGVSVINNINEAQTYISNIKENLDQIMVQEFVPYTNEVGILFERNLFDNSGKIKSMVKRSIKENTV
jgi:hypothetical protein